MDDARASAAALDHLVGLGHERIGHVAGPRTLDPASGGATPAFRTRPSDRPARRPSAEGEFSENGGGSRRPLAPGGHPRLTALYVSTLGAGRGRAARAGSYALRVPEDLSLITYDDMPLAEYLRPPLTTIRMPLSELGAAGVDALLDQLLGGEPRDVVVAGEPEVVVRSSTAPPPRS